MKSLSIAVIFVMTNCMTMMSISETLTGSDKRPCVMQCIGDLVDMNEHHFEEYKTVDVCEKRKTMFKAAKSFCTRIYKDKRCWR